MLVAGMLPNTSYHMQASIQLSGSVSATDVDHTFHTGGAPIAPNLSVATTAGMTPQSGVEELTFIDGVANGLAVTDLQGNVLWSYVLPGGAGPNQVQVAKLLREWRLSAYDWSKLHPASYWINVSQGYIDTVREIDLAGTSCGRFRLLI